MVIKGDERMNSEMLHMLGYVNANQWADAVIHACETGLLPSDLYTILKEVDAHYSMHMIDNVREIVKERRQKNE